MGTITGTTRIINLYPNLNATHRRRYNYHKPPISTLSFPIPTTKFPFSPLKISHKPLKPLTFASLNPNFSQNPSFLSNFTPACPLFFASLSSNDPIAPLKPLLSKSIEFLKPLKTTLWAFLGAVMGKFYHFIGENPNGVLNTPIWPAVAGGLAKWLDIFSGVLMVRILLSWFPNMPWEMQPFSAIRDLCDPFLSLFRTIFPPVFGNLDVSPLLAFAVLGTLGSILGNAQAAPVF